MSKKSIEFEFSQIDAELEIVQMLKTIDSQNGLDKIQLRAAASCLHSIYNGVEKIIYQVLKENNVDIKPSSKWHSNLLEKALEMNIISDEHFSSLKEYMGFRHYYRHSYGFMIDAELLRPLINNVSNVMNQLKKQLL